MPHIDKSYFTVKFTSWDIILHIQKKLNFNEMNCFPK